MELMHPVAGQSILDVGSGSGYFSRHFADAGLQVTGVDPDPAMNQYARASGSKVNYIQGDAQRLPFPDNAFDYCAAVTSLCFIDEPQMALTEMWRVCRHGMVLGLLNRNSLLYLMKYQHGGYRGARWDTVSKVCHWLQALTPSPEVTIRSAIWLPYGGRLSQKVESLMPAQLPWGGFLAIGLKKRK
jgi:ubiquinone/menaquinone biosynthesis C-methylase UbiE